MWGYTILPNGIILKCVKNNSHSDVIEAFYKDQPKVYSINLLTTGDDESENSTIKYFMHRGAIRIVTYNREEQISINIVSKRLTVQAYTALKLLRPNLQDRPLLLAIDIPYSIYVESNDRYTEKQWSALLSKLRRHLVEEGE